MSDSAEVPFDIDVNQLKTWLDEERDVHLLDIREPHEVELCRLEDSRHIPMREIPQRLDEIDREVLTVVHCHHGPRSSQVVMYLRQQGYDKTINLDGGIDAWSLKIDSSVGRY